MTAPLQHAASVDRRLRDELLRLYPSLAEDDQALADTLDGESDFDRVAGAVLRSLLIDEALADGVDELIQECRARKLRFEERAQTKKAALTAALEHAGRKRLELPEGTLTIRSNPGSAIITDEDKVPARYIVLHPATIDKRAVTTDLRDGKEVPGATLSNGSTSLQIRKG